MRRFSLSRSENPQALRLAIQAKYPHHKHVFVPLVNLSPDKEEGCRPELHLRLDALHILGHLAVDPADLVYARGCGSLSSEKALRDLHSNGQLRMILVDHNAYKGKMYLVLRTQAQSTELLPWVCVHVCVCVCGGGAVMT